MSGLGATTHVAQVGLATVRADLDQKSMRAALSERLGVKVRVLCGDDVSTRSASAAM